MGAAALLLAACDTGDYTVRFVVGRHGLIINTTDAGATWSAQTSGVTVTLNGVAFAGTKNGCTVGEKATVLRTTDGSTWQPATTVPTSNELNAVDLVENVIGAAPTVQEVSPFVAFAAGVKGTILYSGDQCDTWTSQTSGTTKTLNGVSTGRCFCSKAWAVGNDGTILYTGNLGTTWSPQTSGVKKDLLAVAFAGGPRGGTGWAVGKGGTILVTTDAGTTWTKQVSNTKLTLEGVAAGDSMHAYVVGDDGVILATSDGGTTWTKQVTQTKTDLDAVSTILNSPFSPNGDWHDAIAVGSGGLILMTTDGGTTWTTSTSGTKQNLEGAA